MTLLAVAIGGSLGALARWGVGLLITSSSAQFPLATLIVNVSGAFGLGAAGVILWERLPPRRHLRPLIGVGFFGAYTTFSTMAVEGIKLISAGRTNMAVVYWLLTLIVGQMAGVYGMWIGRLQLPIGGSKG